MKLSHSCIKKRNNSSICNSSISFIETNDLGVLDHSYLGDRFVSVIKNNKNIYGSAHSVITFKRSKY